MLALSVVREIERLLGEGGLSQRQIAARVGVSKSSVASIANGRRGNWGRESRDGDSPDTPTQRCRSCGAMVTMPCVACAVRAYRRRQRLWAELARHDSGGVIGTRFAAPSTPPTLERVA